jgi:hypothetical protein
MPVAALYLPFKLKIPQKVSLKSLKIHLFFSLINGIIGKVHLPRQRILFQAIHRALCAICGIFVKLRKKNK